MKNGLDKKIEVLKKIPAEIKLKMKIQLSQLKILMSSLPRHGITQETECKGTGSSIQKYAELLKTTTATTTTTTSLSELQKLGTQLKDQIYDHE